MSKNINSVSVLQESSLIGWVAEELQKRTIENGGLTFNFKLNNYIENQEYYAVAMYPEAEEIISLESFTADKIEAYILKNKELLQDRRNSLGTWLDTDSNKIYLDISRTVSRFDDAIMLAKEHSQLAIFDLLNLKEIRL